MNEYIRYDRRAFSRVFLKIKKPVVTICPKDGRIILNYGAISLLGCKEGQALEFIQDREDPQQWGIRHCEEDSGFLLRKRRDGALCFNCRQLAKRIACTFGKIDSFRIQIAADPKDGIYWFIPQSAQ